jgi:hypothetical protein
VRRLLAAAVVVLALAGATGCEASMTITAKADPARPACFGAGSIAGVVTPAGATPKVVLQRTEGGKWVDWKWFVSHTSEGRHVISTTVDSAGKYRLSFLVPRSSATLHLRARSAGSGATSPGVYVTPRPAEPGDCG